MDTVMLRCGQVTNVLGSPVTDSSGKIISYDGVTTNQTGAAKYKDSGWATFQAVVTGTGAVTATVTIYGSNAPNGDPYCSTALGTITLSGSDEVSDGFTTVAPWKFIVPVLTNLSGTDAECYVLMGV